MKIYGAILIRIVNVRLLISGKNTIKCLGGTHFCFLNITKAFLGPRVLCELAKRLFAPQFNVDKNRNASSALNSGGTCQSLPLQLLQLEHPHLHNIHGILE